MLQQSIDLAEQRADTIKTGDARTKAARIAQCEDALREVAAMRKSFMMEFQLLKPPEKQPYRTAMEGYDRRIANVTQTLKWEQTAFDKQSLVGDKQAQGPATTDQMVRFFSR